jgi:hypothetical protein
MEIGSKHCLSGYIGCTPLEDDNNIVHNHGDMILLQNWTRKNWEVFMEQNVEVFIYWHASTYYNNVLIYYNKLLYCIIIKLYRSLRDTSQRFY